MADEKFKRWIAVKTNLKNIKSSEYIDEGPEKPNYLLNSEGKKLFRVNVMATVLDIKLTGTITNFLVDDGSCQIMLRFFEDSKFKEGFNVGDPVLVVGRIREFNNEKYLTPDFVRKVDPRWLKVRALELNVKNSEDNSKPPLESAEFEGKKNDKVEAEDIKDKKELKNGLKDEKQNYKKDGSQVKSEEMIIEDLSNENLKEEEAPPAEKIFGLIKKLDNGEGVMIEDLIEKSSVDGAEKIIEIMVQNGEIFQNLPGRVKVL